MRAAIAALTALAALAVSQPAGAAVAPVRWCGTDQRQLDRAPDYAGGPQIHVIYAIPADGQDRFAELASPLTTDIAGIDAWWRANDPTRAPRFDLVETRCETRFGQLDLTFARLPQGTAFYAELPAAFERIPQALASPPFNFFTPTKKHLVFYDGLISDPSAGARGAVCGVSQRQPFAGGATSYATVFLRAGCTTSIGTGGGNAIVALHELLHMLGAVPDRAPNECDDGGHVCDTERDILYPFLRFDSLDEVVLDAGRNDYYGHDLDLFDLQDSRWLLHVQSQVILGVAIDGRGAVRVGSTPCTTTCRSEWNAGSTVLLQALPGDGGRFYGWSGACAGSASTCSVTLDAAKTVTARFRPTAMVSVRVSGRGSVTGSLRCSSSCSATVATGAKLALRARPARGWRFLRWSGACRSSRPTCAATAAGDTRVVAVFGRRSSRS